MNVQHVSGHKFVPNGAGDFNLQCPTHGMRPGFIPYMTAVTASARICCPLCKLPIGERVEVA